MLHRKTKIAVLASVVALLGATAWAVIPATRVSGVQISTNSATPVNSGSTGVWVDSSSRLRYDNGSSSLYIPAGAVASKGDLVVFTGSAWTVLSGSGATNGQVISYDSTQTGGLKWSSTGAGNVIGTMTAGRIQYAISASSLSDDTDFQWDSSGHSLIMAAGDSASVSAGGTGRLRYNTGTNHWEISENGGSYAQLSTGTALTGSGTSGTIPVFTGTSAIGNSSLTSSSGNLTLATGKTFTSGSNVLITSDQLAASKLLIASQAVGDLLYADTTTSFARRAAVAAGSYLRSAGTGTAPVWSTLVLPNAATVGDVPIATSSNTVTMLADVAAGSFLRSGGVSTAPAWSTLVVPNSATTGDIPIATSANTLTMLGAGTATYVLTSNGAGVAPSWQAAAGGSSIDGLLGAYTAASATSKNIIGLTTALGPVLIRNNATPITTTLFGIQTSDGSTTKFLDITTTAHNIGQSVATSGSPTAFKVVSAAHTTLAATTEAISSKFDLSATVQFSQGTIATQRAFAILAPTYAFDAGATISKAATFAVSDAPTAGTNATLTAKYAIWAQAGLTQLDGGLTVTGGAYSLTGNAASTLTTSSGALTIDSASTMSIGATNATTMTIGRTNQTVNVPSALVATSSNASLAVFAVTPASGNAIQTMTIPANTAYVQLLLQDQAAATRGYLSYIGSNAGLSTRNDTVEWGSSAKDMTVRPNETERARFASAGTIAFTPASGVTALSIGSTSTFDFDTTNTRFGIGTAAPTSIIHATNATASGTTFTLANTATSNSGFARWIFQTTAREWRILNDDTAGAAGKFVIYDNTASQYRLTISSTGVVSPGVDVTNDFGSSSERWKNVWARRYNGVVQSVASSATPAFDSTNGQTIRNILTANVTSWTLAAGNPGEVVTIVWQQNGSGGFTVAGTPSNVLLAGGAWTMTATASKTDTLTFRYDSTDLKWYEIGRSQNM